MDGLQPTCPKHDGGYTISNRSFCRRQRNRLPQQLLKTRNRVGLPRAHNLQPNCNESACMIEKLLGIVILLTATMAAAADSDSSDSRFTLFVSPYVYHFSDNDSHNNEPRLVGLEWGPQGSWVDFGATYFRNSFYQDSFYAYVGKRWFMGEHDQGLFLRLTGVRSTVTAGSTKTRCRTITTGSASPSFPPSDTTIVPSKPSS